MVCIFMNNQFNCRFLYFLVVDGVMVSGSPHVQLIVDSSLGRFKPKTDEIVCHLPLLR